MDETTDAPRSGPDEDGAPSAMLRWATGIEEDRRLDPAVDRLRALAGTTLGTGPARHVLGGRWLGHALHPLLTDLPLGLWLSATTLDWVGGRAARPAARRLVGLGVLAAVPTALTGASDSTAIPREQQRVAVVHAAANTAALGAYAASWVARRRGHVVRGRLLAVAGGGAAVVGGYLGGHLTLARDAGRRATADVLGDTRDGSGGDDVADGVEADITQTAAGG